MGHIDHRGTATALGITVADLKHVIERVTDAELGLGRMPRRNRCTVVADRLGLSPAELTRLRLALVKGTHGTREREVVQRLAREEALVP